MTDSSTRPAYFTFAVYSLNVERSFDAFLMDVPTLDGDENRAARRAYFSAMAHLNQQGIDVEDFQVSCWHDDAPGPLVGPGGIDHGATIDDRPGDV